MLSHLAQLWDNFCGRMMSRVVLAALISRPLTVPTFGSSTSWMVVFTTPDMIFTTQITFLITKPWQISVTCVVLYICIQNYFDCARLIVVQSIALCLAEQWRDEILQTEEADSSSRNNTLMPNKYLNYYKYSNAI